MDVQTVALLRGIMGVIGAASIAACAAREVSEGGGESEASTEATSTGAETSMSTEGSTSAEGSTEGEESDSDQPPILDVGGGDPTGGEGCGEFVADPWDLDFEIPPLCENPPMSWASSEVCFFPPPGTSCEDEPYSQACVLEAYNCGLIQGGEEIGCGPITTGEGACCYIVYGDCAVGRPFHVRGQARRAGLVRGHRWRGVAQQQPETASLGASTRAALADAWGSYGQSEHASIASFARFGVQLLALGAPASLVRASVRAGVDERRHAALSFGLAGAYARRASDPGALETHACHEARGAVEIARDLAREGCVAETVSWLLLRGALGQARDPAVQASLAEIVADEERHVLLAWEALAWMCRRFGAPVREAAARVFGDAAAHVGFGATTSLEGDAKRMREHGYLSIEARRELALRALSEIVAPAARGLLRGASDATSSRVCA